MNLAKERVIDVDSPKLVDDDEAQTLVDDSSEETSDFDINLQKFDEKPIDNEEGPKFEHEFKTFASK